MVQESYEMERIQNISILFCPYIFLLSISQIIKIIFLVPSIPFKDWQFKKQFLTVSKILFYEILNFFTQYQTSSNNISNYL